MEVRLLGGVHIWLNVVFWPVTDSHRSMVFTLILVVIIVFVQNSSVVSAAGWIEVYGLRL